MKNSTTFALGALLAACASAASTGVSDEYTAQIKIIDVATAEWKEEIINETILNGYQYQRNLETSYEIEITLGEEIEPLDVIEFWQCWDDSDQGCIIFRFKQDLVSYKTGAYNNQGLLDGSRSGKTPPSEAITGDSSDNFRVLWTSSEGNYDLTDDQISDFVSAVSSVDGINLKSEINFKQSLVDAKRVDKEEELQQIADNADAMAEQANRQASAMEDKPYYYGIWISKAVEEDFILCITQSDPVKDPEAIQLAFQASEAIWLEDQIEERNNDLNELEDPDYVEPDNQDGSNFGMQGLATALTSLTFAISALVF